jgi:hypothetical protein
VTVACFFAFHETILFPRNITKPHVDFLSSIHPAQSAFEYPFTNIDDDLPKVIPRPRDDLMYLNIHFTVVQCTFVGA